MCACTHMSCHIISKLKDVINFMEISSIYTDYINYDMFLEWRRACAVHGHVFLPDVTIVRLSVGGQI